MWPGTSKSVLISYEGQNCSGHRYEMKSLANFKCLRLLQLFTYTLSLYIKTNGKMYYIIILNYTMIVFCRYVISTEFVMPHHMHHCISNKKYIL